MTLDVPRIHGIEPNAVMTICQYTYTVGKAIVRSPNLVVQVNVMGMTFQYEEERVSDEFVLNKRRGWPYDQSTLGRKDRHHPIIVSYVKRRLSGDDWKVWIDHSTSNRGMINGLASLGYLRWGDAQFEYLRHGFEGNVENFVNQMVIVKMIGDDPETWNALELL